MEHTDIKIPWPEWQVAGRLGTGGFGDVYKIERLYYGAKEEAALKVLKIPKDPDEIQSAFLSGYDESSVRNLYKSYLKDIENEYHLMRKMRGTSNIVSCEDYCEVEHKDDIGWDIFIRMELLTPLQKYVKNKELTEEEIIKLGKDICRALIVCETENIVHRDIKPENILVSKYGDFKLGDFGVARVMDHTTHATKAGTDWFMAPEVSKQEPYGKEVDIYSLGLVMYWLLNKRMMPFLPVGRPAKAEEISEAKINLLQGKPIPLPAEGSEALKRIVLKAFAYRKEDRYQSAKELLAALEQVSYGTTEDSSDIAFAETLGYSSIGTATGPKFTSNSIMGIKEPKTNENGWHDNPGTIGIKRASVTGSKETVLNTSTIGPQAKDLRPQTGYGNSAYEKNRVENEEKATVTTTVAGIVLYVILHPASLLVLYIVLMVKLYYGTKLGAFVESNDTAGIIWLLFVPIGLILWEGFGFVIKRALFNDNTSE